MLNLDRLRVLHAVARQGSVVAAAAELHVTASAVSQQLAKLEREVGRPLVERYGRGIRLTSAAELLADRAGPILSLVAQASSDLEEQGGAVAGRLSLAAFATAARGLVPPAAILLRAEHPELELSVSEREPSEALDAVAAGDLDVAVVQEWRNARLPRPGGLTFTALAEDPVDLAVPEDWPVPDDGDADGDRGDGVVLEQLADAEWVASSPGTVCHDWLRQTLRERGYEPRVVHAAAEVPTQIAWVAAGLGLALIPRLGRLPHPGVRYLPLHPVLRRQLLVVRRADATNRPAVRAVVRALAEVAREVAEPIGS